MSEAVVRACGPWAAACITVLPLICERTSLNLILATQRNSAHVLAVIAEES